MSFVVRGDGNAAVVHLIDADAALRAALARLLSAAGYQVRAHARGGDYLRRDAEDAPGCLLLDLHLPDIGGLELQARLTQDPTLQRPIVFLAGGADVRASVQAMRAGACEFLTKPVEPQRLLAAVAEAVARDGEARERRRRTRHTQRLVDSLGQRQRRVLDGIVAGRLYKQLAVEFGVSERTIKLDRAHVMQRLGVRNLPALMKVLIEAERFA
ncbi:response regulator transcription factor [Roseateles violae]|uniref:Response regulator n=1 Tax=Roseateles violae TaxID=3058042 RepID=A0ABT8DZR1_9BURK|nr:response regulator [Pelomonas sp. PFR6]MDN3923103.1 response regulator [Pelomonas sp. PFR6]